MSGPQVAEPNPSPNDWAAVEAWVLDRQDAVKTIKPRMVSRFVSLGGGLKTNVSEPRVNAAIADDFAEALRLLWIYLPVIKASLEGHRSGLLNDLEGPWSDAMAELERAE